mgnify:CR=1 FL=1
MGTDNVLFLLLCDSVFFRGKQIVVSAGDGLALGDLVVQARQLGQDDGGLKAVHASADADAAVDVAGALAVGADLAAGLGELVVVRSPGMLFPVFPLSNVSRYDT